MGGSCIGVDLVSEILIRLPVLSLLRFKSACKLWRAVIEASDFIYRHAIYEDESSKYGTFIFHNTYTECDKTYFLLSYNALDEELVLKDLDVPPLLEEMRRNGVALVGSCQGLICLADFERKDVYLWNPATKKIKLLRKPLTPRHPNVVLQNDITYFGNVSYVFGFDVEAKDFKLLMFSSFWPFGDRGYRTSCCCYVQVYSLNADCWRHLDIDLKLSEICCSYTHGRTGRYVNGKYYFAGGTSVWKDDEMFTVQKVLSFDFSKETFKTLRSIEKYGIYVWTLISERVSFIEQVDVIDSEQLFYEVWEFDECSGKESWTKRYTLGPFCSMKYFIGISKNGEIGIILTEIAELCNFGTQEMKKVQSGEVTFSMECDSYKESLF